MVDSWGSCKYITSAAAVETSKHGVTGHRPLTLTSRASFKSVTQRPDERVSRGSAYTRLKYLFGSVLSVKLSYRHF